MLTVKPTVHYKRHTTNVELKLIVSRIAEVLGRDIVVHSGDRDFSPQGSPAKSLHLAHRAVDLHVSGLTDSQVFDLLKLNRGKIFESAVNSYQVIHHGPFTATEAEHIHIGHYHLIKSYVTGPGVTFFVEGLTSATGGQYRVVQ